MVAIIEVLLCSDLLTQYAIGGTLIGLGYQPKTAGKLNVGYVVALSLGDAVLLIGLILLLLHAHGERPRDVLLGRRPIVAESVLGLLLIPIAFGIAISVILSVQRFAPSLHNVANNPLQGLLGLFWGVVYVRRRSSLAPIVSHAGFDLLQVVPYLSR